MTKCHELKKDQIYHCPDCGLELKVIKECKETSTHKCHADDSGCSFKCCGKSLKKK